MKVAVIMSGFLRTWDQSKPSFLKLLLKNVDYDLFAHVYRENFFEYSAGQPDVFYKDDDIKNLFSGVNLKKLKIENRKDIEKDLEKEAEKYKNIKNYNIQINESSDIKSKKVNLGIRIYDQIRKNYLCNCLRKQYENDTGVKYDFVIKTRFDVLYLNSPQWENYKDKKNIYIGSGACMGSPDDVLGIGTPDAMDEGYFSRFTNMDKLCFSTVKKNSTNYSSWNPSWGDTLLPTREFCAHETLHRNIVYSGYNIENANVNIRVIRNKNKILNWNECMIKNKYVPASKITNGIIEEGNNSNFDIDEYNESLY